MARRALIAAFFCGLIFSTAVWFGSAMANPSPWAGLAEVPFRHYGMDAGLPSPVVNAMTEDRAGFLWVGTQGGLGRWDGYRFRTYQPDAANPNALPDSWITALHTDRSGRLWIGTSAGGLARYDRDKDQFINYRAGPQGLTHVHVTAIVDANDGGLWVATDGGLNHLDPATGQITAYRHKAADPTSLPEDKIQSLLMDRRGVLWIGGAHSGLARLNPSNERFETVPVKAGAGGEVSIFSLFQDQGGSIWIGARHGAFTISPGESRPRAVVETDGAGFDLKTEWVYTIAAGKPGQVWLGTIGEGIVAVDVASGRTQRIRHASNALNSLASDTIWSLYKDRSGGVWVGSTGDLGRLEDNNGSVLMLSGTERTHALAESDVEAIMPTSDGKVWVGMGTKGVEIFDLDRNRISHIVPNNKNPDKSLPQSYVISLFQWSSDAVYIGTAAGLYHADVHDGHVARVKLPGRDPAARDYAIAAAGGKLWLGGADDGLWAFTPGAKTSDLEHYAADRLTDPRIVSLASDPSGRLWIGTRNGLNMLDLASRKIEKIFPEPKNPTALKSAYIPSLLIDRGGRLWVTTEGGGIQVLARWRAGRPEFRRIDTTNGLPSDNVSSLLQDGDGEIWVYTEGGVAVIDPSTFAVQPLSRADGVPSSIPWDHSAARLPTGELLFGTAGESGITVVQPERFHPWTYRPPVVVTEARVGGEIVPANRFNSDRNSDPLVVQPRANSLSIEFAALDYSSPKSNQYAYRLEGYDKDWIETDSSHRLASYTNLPPGRYVLHLRGSNRNDGWSEKSLSLPIRVRPAWFQTLWFRLLIMLGGLICVFAVVHARTRYLRRQKRALEHQIAERTVQLEAAVKAAEAANVAKGNFLATMSHEIRTPLNGVLGMAQAMSVDDLADIQRSRLDIIRQSGQGLLVILNDILDLSKIEAGKLDIEEIEFDLREIIDDAYNAFASILDKKGLSFEKDMATAAGIYWGDPVRIRQVLYNLFSNATKFTSTGGLQVIASYDGDELCVSVSDTGVGMSPEVLGRLFGKFVQADASTTRNFGGTGLGLSISRQLAELMGGSLNVRSTLGAGSTFSLRLPLRRLHDAAEPAAQHDGDSNEISQDFDLRVLAAEDNEINQLVLKTLLAQVGVEPLFVSDGQQAVAAWKEKEFDVILMDVQMPNMDGPTATRLIRGMEQSSGRTRTPIIALTANAMAHHVAEYMASGMDTHVAKPIEAAKLYAALDSVLSYSDATDMYESDEAKCG